MEGTFLEARVGQKGASSMNISWSREILQALHRDGVRDIVYCPGARNSPLVAVLAQTRGFDLHSFFEERSGAFFALGIARRTGQPVAIVTTSGTAACELLPAAAEAFHTGVPVIFVTADRPKRLRGTGAPQAIDQAGLFAKFAGREFDLESGEMFSFDGWNRRSPVHLNVCFDEPLLDEPVETSDLGFKAAHGSFAGRSGFPVSTGTEWALLRMTKFIRQGAAGTLVTIVGTLESEAERESVAKFLVRLGSPVYLEGTSGLRERPELRELSLRSGDQLLSWALQRGLVGRILRIGGVPTVRMWRDLDEPDSAIEVLSLSPLPFAGLSRGELVCAEVSPVLDALDVHAEPGSLAGALYMKDRSNEEGLATILRGEAFSEPALMRALSEVIPDSSMVYLGNSLPIREWDLAASRKSAFCVEANRGVNGIDGQIASFLGLARANVENWAIIGDLTALYDLVAPWALSSRRDLDRVRIVVINNGGGRIFSRLFNPGVFENRHLLSFEGWAKMWNIPYQKWTSVPENYDSKENVEIIELVPDDVSTEQFWRRFDELWA